MIKAFLLTTFVMHCFVACYMHTNYNRSSIIYKWLISGSSFILAVWCGYCLFGIGVTVGVAYFAVTFFIETISTFSPWMIENPESSTEGVKMVASMCEMGMAIWALIILL